MDKLIIKKATHKDEKAMSDLWYDVIEHAFKGQPIDDYHNVEDEHAFKMDQLKEAFEKNKSTYFVAYDDNELVGTIAYGTPPNRGILRRTGNDLIDAMEIGSLYIKPSLQKKGYGRALLIYILDYLSNNEVDTVCFDSVIETSKKLWTRMFGEPKYMIRSKKHDFVHMIWVVDVKASLKRIRQIDQNRDDQGTN